MRTLLIDNYDSFTFNLFHLLARVNGQEPVVIRNDEQGWEIGRLSDFDNVVLSPGPGTPECSTDFGICQEIVRAADRPVLGVCLGHQGIAALHGSSVRRAPEPRHGRISLIEHSGKEIFEGLPSPFEAVRYHSLTVTDLSPELEATAWTRDGILMGLRHRSRPLWGVQFHPESISTEHGLQLMENFRALTARWQAAGGAGRTQAKLVQASAESPRRMAVLVRRLPTLWDAEVVFDELLRCKENAFWLDSSRSDDSLGRFSIMGGFGGSLARVAMANVAEGTVTVVSEENGARRRQVIRRSFLDWIDEDLRSCVIDAPALPFQFTLGWVGYLGYELKAQCGAGAIVHRSAEPDAMMVFADRALVFDHLEGMTYLLALAPAEAAGDQRAAALAKSAQMWLRDTTSRLRDLAGRNVTADAPALPVDAASLRLRHDEKTYLEHIKHSQEEIAAGETYEVCLTNMIESSTPIDPWQGYRFLRRSSPAPFAALLLYGEVAVLSTSPERFLQVSQEGLVESKPIKGTRPRGRTPDEDAALMADLRASEKDRSENLMIVDLVRNDLGRCAVVGSVHVPKLFDVETYASVHQLVSTVRAQLRPDLTAVDCVRAAFPGGSMTGAPKIRTMQIIDGLEGGPRGVYSGAIGYFSLSGAADFSIVIRTVVATQAGLRYGVGGAIVALSDPADEFEETITKAVPLLRLLGANFPGRGPGFAEESAEVRPADMSPVIQ
jgi:para-aminobenzoate synthetase